MGINNQQYRVTIGSFNPARGKYIAGRHCNSIYNDFDVFILTIYLLISHLCNFSDKSYHCNGYSLLNAQFKDSYGQTGNVCFVIKIFSLIMYYVYILCIMMAMQIDIERSSDHGGRNDILLMVPNNLFTCGFNTHRKYLNSGFILLLCIAIGKYWNTGSYSRSSSIHKHTVNSRCFNVIRNILLKKPYLYCYWVATINIILIVIANISILNPGPTIDNNLSNISLMYLNVRGFVRFYELKSKSPTFYTNKILEFQSYIFEKKNRCSSFK